MNNDKVEAILDILERYSTQTFTDVYLNGRSFRKAAIAINDLFKKEENKGEKHD